MRLRLALWIGLAGLAGCRFDPSGLSAAEPGPGSDAGLVPAPDARDQDPDGAAGEPDAGELPAPECDEPLKRWRAELDEDPTTIDENGDGDDDWRFLGAGEFQDEFEDIWRAEEFQSLHINPQDDFTGVTVAEVRMRSVEVDPDPDDLGAVFWLSADTNLRDPGFTAVYVSLKRQQDGTQDLRLANALSSLTHVPLLDVTGLDGDFVDVRLRVDVDASRVDLWVEGTHRGSAVYAPARDNHFAGVVAFGSDAEFDRVRVEICER